MELHKWGNVFRLVLLVQRPFTLGVFLILQHFRAQQQPSLKDYLSSLEDYLSSLEDYLSSLEDYLSSLEGYLELYVMLQYNLAHLRASNLK